MRCSLFSFHTRKLGSLIVSPIKTAAKRVTIFSLPEACSMKGCFASENEPIFAINMNEMKQREEQRLKN